MPTVDPPHDRRTRALGVLLSAAPFVAALVAVLGARHDPRMLWMALVATLSARLVVALAAERRGRVMAAGVALLVATAVATGVAYLLGARSGPGSAMVAIVLAGFATAGASLTAPSRSRAT